MFKAQLKWKFAAALVVTFSVLGVLNATVLQDRFCPVIDDFRAVNTKLVTNKFDQSKIAYYVDFQNSHQVLVEQSQVKDAYRVLDNLGINQRSNLTATCRVIH